MAKQPKKPDALPDYTKANAERDYRQVGYLSGLSSLPVSWAAQSYRPDGSKPCSCCGNREWWSEGRGWCCSTCHPHTTNRNQTVERAPARQQDAA